MTALRWINGITLLMAISACLVVGALQWLGRFAKGASQTVWHTGVMFASGFQKTPPPIADPSVDWDVILATATFAALWVSVFIPTRLWWMHGCAMAAAMLAAWSLYTLRDNFLAPVQLTAVALWAAFYYIAAWR